MTTTAMSNAPADHVMRTDLPLPNRRQGKVRDVYQLPAENGKPSRILIIASDRISAFDVVLPTPIPGKGKMLTEISTKWFEFVRTLNLVKDHVISTDVSTLPQLDDKAKKQIAGRTTIGRAAKVIPIEFVVRGYLAGSGWSEYKKTGKVCGVSLPAGLKQCDKLPEPIFTPATKADVGHDENIEFDRACEIAGRDVMTKLRDVSMKIYEAGRKFAEPRGIILADTKFEFGYALDDNGKPSDEILLIDEVLTPDSSRFWPADKYAPGRDQESFDKQYVRNYLLTLVEKGEWDKTPPGPELPADVVKNTLAKYREAREKLFG